MSLPKPLSAISHVPLRWALTLPFVLSTVGATALVGYLSYQSGQKAVDELRHQLVLGINDRVQQELKTYLQTPLLINRLNVDAVNQGQLDLQNISDLEATLFNRLQQFDRQVSAVLFANPEGLFRLVDRLPDLYLVTANPAQPDQILIYQLDNQGKRSKFVTTLKGLDVRRDRPWYQRAVRAGGPSWSPISQYGSTEFLTLDASQPVYDPTRKRLLGVFAVHVRIDYLSEFLHQLDISRYGQILIMDQQGNLVATSTQEAPYQFKSGTGYHQQFQQLKIYESRDALTQSLGKYLRDHTNTFQSQTQTQDLDFHYAGEQQFVKITPFQDQHGLNWRIVTVLPQSHFLAEIQQNARTTVLLCLLTLSGAIGLGLCAANWFISHLAQLNRASRELAAGNLNQSLTTNSPISELNSLAQTFNQMADQLQQSFDRIRTALEESEEKFTTIFRTSPDPIAIISLAEGRLLEVNDSLIEFFGYDRAEMIGRTTVELNFWHDLTQRDQCQALLYQQGSAQNLEVQLCVKSGAVKTVLLSAGVQSLEGQDCVIVIHRDITDRKQIEKQLRRTEQWLHHYSQLSPGNIYTMVRDLDGHYWFEYISSAIEAIHEITAAAILKDARLILHAIHPDDAAGFHEAMHYTGETLAPFSHEWRVITPSGRVKWLQGNSQPERRSNGTVAWHGVMTDITERKATELAIQQSEANLLQAQRIAHLGSWELDPITQTFSWSEELFRITGLDPNQPEPARPDLVTMIPTGDREILEAAVEQALTDGTPYEVEHRFCRPDGTIRYLNSKGQMVWNDLQQTFRLVGTVLDITDRKTVEIALRQYERIVSATIDAISLVDHNYRYQIVNQTYLDWNQKSYSEIVGHTVGELIGQEVFESLVQPYLDRCLAGETIQYHEWFEFPALGRQFVSVTYSPFSETDQTISGVVVSVRNITPLKQAELALQEREAMLRAIGDNLPKGFIYQRVYEPGKGSYYSYISAGIERLLGLKPEAVIQNPELIRSIGFAEDLAVADQVVQESLKHLSPIELQMRNRTVEGKIQWSSIRSTPRRLEDGRIVWDGVEVDITDLKQTEAALRASEELFRGAFDNAPIGISLVSTTGQFVKVNACYCELLGYSEAELLNLTFAEITHPADLEADLQGFQQMMAGEIRSFQMEKRYITKQGTIVPVLMNAALIRDQIGQPLYCVGQVQDIRDRQKVEQMKDEFISVVSHELRTPLTSIRGALGILGSGIFDNRPKKAKHMLTIALNNSDRLARLVDDILTLERLESGKVELIMEPCQASELIQQAVDSVQAIADQSQVILAVTSSDIHFLASADAIIQTLTNLLSNAIKFSAAGQTVRLEVSEIREIRQIEENSSSPSCPSSPSILFTVQDQGRGIPADKLEIIFEQFQQVDVSDSRKKGGTGLGLAICKKIVQQHGGQIWAESVLGEGSSFYFTLPLKQESD